MPERKRCSRGESQNMSPQNGHRKVEDAPRIRTLVVQHPNMNNVTQVFSFDYNPIIPYDSLNDTGMFSGIRYYNDVLMKAEEEGNVQSELILKKDNINTFSFKQGWVFPGKVYFNGDECKKPLPDNYPILPNSAYLNVVRSLTYNFSLLLLIFLIF